MYIRNVRFHLSLFSSIKELLSLLSEMLIHLLMLNEAACAFINARKREGETNLLELLLPALLGFRFCQHDIPRDWRECEMLFLRRQKRLQFRNELSTRSQRIEFKDKVVVARYT